MNNEKSDVNEKIFIDIKKKNYYFALFFKN